LRTRFDLIGPELWAVCLLILLIIGLDLKVISPTMFAMLVVMAVVTTVATTPVLDAVNRPSR
jgi:hypothetical protein